MNQCQKYEVTDKLEVYWQTPAQQNIELLKENIFNKDHMH